MLRNIGPAEWKDEEITSPESVATPRCVPKRARTDCPGNLRRWKMCATLRRKNPSMYIVRLAASESLVTLLAAAGQTLNRADSHNIPCHTPHNNVA